MLDQGESLATWSLSVPPTVGSVLAARLLADHRREYLDYEGPVSGDRGTVARWDEGQFEWVERSGRQVVVDLRGRKLVGRVHIEATGEAPDDFRWHLTAE